MVSIAKRRAAGAMAEAGSTKTEVISNNHSERLRSMSRRRSRSVLNCYGRQTGNAPMSEPQWVLALRAICAQKRDNMIEAIREMQHNKES